MELISFLSDWRVGFPRIVLFEDVLASPLQGRRERGLVECDLTLISVIDRRVRLSLSQGRGYGVDFFSV